MRWPFWKRGEEDSGANTPSAAVSAYLDGEVTPAERAQIEGDLSAQPDLTSTLEAYTDLKTLLRAMPDEQPRRSFALTAEMAGAAQPAKLPERVHAPKRPPFLLYVGQAAAGIGVFGLMVVGVSGLFGGSSSGDDGGDFAAIAANKDGHANGEIMSTASSAEDAQDTAGGAAPGAPESATGDGTPASDVSPLSAENPPEAPASDDPGTEEFNEDADDISRNSLDPAAEETAAASSMAMTAAYDAAPEDDGGPSGRQIALIVFGLIAAAGGGAWLAVAMHIREKNEQGAA